MTSFRRCKHLHLAPVEVQEADPLGLLAGGCGLVSRQAWHALAAHLDAPVVLEDAEAMAVGRISAGEWKTEAELQELVGADCLASLRRKGLVVESGDPIGASGVSGAPNWHMGSAIAHAFSRWSGCTQPPATADSLPDAVALMVQRYGPPPPHFHRREDAVARIALAEPARTALDDLLERRATCRNFDRSHSVPATQLSALLKRVFGVHGMEELAPGAVALKKNHPSGGALHPVEAYLVVQRVEGLASGLYHYNVEAHALDLLREMPADEAHAFAMTTVAGQEYFADAPVMVMMAARFARSMWKYRNHPKIYRAILLEMGHISQNLYLTATEMNLGAFITAAINEMEIEQAFSLEPMSEGPLCVCGFGARGAAKTTVEFDPAHKVWPAGHEHREG